jgi:hypothetical protein
MQQQRNWRHGVAGSQYFTWQPFKQQLTKQY